MICPTTPIVNIFNGCIMYIDAGHHRVNLVVPATVGEAKDVPVEQADHILAIDASRCLPTNMEDPTQLYVPERPHLILRVRVKSLFEALAAWNDVTSRTHPVGKDYAIL